jgi:hypothetical protein
MVEFALAGIVVLTFIPAVVQLSIGMWNYHTLAYAVHEGARYAGSHGRGCITGSSTCGINVAKMMTNIRANAVGLTPSALGVTLITDSGSSIACNPVTSCSSNSTLWPPTSNMDNLPGKKVTVSATYTFRVAALMIWPGAGSAHFGTFRFPAKSTETIIF